MQPTDKESWAHIIDITATYQTSLQHMIYLGVIQFVHTLALKRKQL